MHFSTDSDATAADLILEPADTVTFVGKQLGFERVSSYLKVTNPWKEDSVAVKVLTTTPGLFCANSNSS